MNFGTLTSLGNLSMLGGTRSSSSAVIPVVTYPLIPTSGTVDGSNKAFVFSSKPPLIISDGLMFRENHGWTWSGSTATMDNPPAYDLFGYSVSGMSIVTPTGLINSSNNNYTYTGTVDLVVSDGVCYRVNKGFTDSVGTITLDVPPSYDIFILEGVTTYFEGVTGTINGSNTSFSYSSRPKLMISDGLSFRRNFGWTWSLPTITLSNPPSFDTFQFGVQIITP